MKLVTCNGTEIMKKEKKTIKPFMISELIVIVIDVYIKLFCRHCFLSLTTTKKDAKMPISIDFNKIDATKTNSKLFLLLSNGIVIVE